MLASSIPCDFVSDLDYAPGGRGLLRLGDAELDFAVRSESRRELANCLGEPYFSLQRSCLCQCLAHLCESFERIRSRLGVHLTRGECDFLEMCGVDMRDK